MDEAPADSATGEVVLWSSGAIRLRSDPRALVRADVQGGCWPPVAAPRSAGQGAAARDVRGRERSRGGGTGEVRSALEVRAEPGAGRGRLRRDDAGALSGAVGGERQGAGGVRSLRAGGAGRQAFEPAADVRLDGGAGRGGSEGHLPTDPRGRAQAAQEGAASARADVAAFGRADAGRLRRGRQGGHRLERPVGAPRAVAGAGPAMPAGP